MYIQGTIAFVILIAASYGYAENSEDLRLLEESFAKAYGNNFYLWYDQFFIYCQEKQQMFFLWSDSADCINLDNCIGLE